MYDGLLFLLLIVDILNGENHILQRLAFDAVHGVEAQGAPAVPEALEFAGDAVAPLQAIRQGIGVHEFQHAVPVFLIRIPHDQVGEQLLCGLVFRPLALQLFIDGHRRHLPGGQMDDVDEVIDVGHAENAGLSQLHILHRPSIGEGARAVYDHGQHPQHGKHDEGIEGEALGE